MSFGTQDGDSKTTEISGTLSLDKVCLGDADIHVCYDLSMQWGHFLYRGDFSIFCLWNPSYLFEERIVSEFINFLSFSEPNTLYLVSGSQDTSD